MSQPYKKSLSGKQLMAKKYEHYALPADVAGLIGEMCAGANIIIWGPPGSGKTTLAMKLVNAFRKHGKCYYNTVEQAGRKSFQKAVERENLHTCPATEVTWGMGDSWEEMTEKLRRNRAHFVFIDSIQYLRFDEVQFKELTKRYPKKCFVVISHGDANPTGPAAQSIRYDVDVKIRVKDGMAYADSRLGGNKPMRLFTKNAAMGPLFD